MNNNIIDPNNLKIVGMTQRMENINQHLNRLEADNKNLLQQVKDLTRHVQIHDEEILWLSDNVTNIRGKVDDKFAKMIHRSKSKIILSYKEYLQDTEKHHFEFGSKSGAQKS